MSARSVIHCRNIALQVDQTADEVMQRMQDLDAIGLDSEAFISLSTFAGPIYVRAIDIVAVDAIPQALDQMDEPPDASVALREFGVPVQVVKP